MNNKPKSQRKIHYWYIVGPILVLPCLLVLLDIACEVVNRPMKGADIEFSIDELGINQNSTMPELTEVATELAHNWQQTAYLHSVSLVLMCDGTPRGGRFVFVANKKFLWHKRQAVAYVYINFEKGTVKMRVDDVNDAGPPDSRLHLDELEMDIKRVLTKADAKIDTPFRENNPDCEITAELKDDIWRIYYSRPGSPMIDDLRITVNTRRE